MAAGGRRWMRAAGTKAIVLCGLIAFAVLLGTSAAIERFPPPDFTGGHVLPETETPPSLARGTGWVDVALLALGLVLASWFSLKLRSRAALVGLSLVSLAYFGFWRRGCVCAIGSIQNVALGAADPGYAVPPVVIAFFVLPLVTALVWGRGFCAGVCPHGAIQDLLLVRPLKVPRPVDAVLRLGPWLYLSLAVVFAATGGWFIICRYDPFIPVFRMAGPRTMFLLAAGMLVLSMFVGRPYCRYLCPLGALLGLASRAAKFRPTVTPDTCTRCRLCEAACPFGALNRAQPTGTPAERLANRRRHLVLVALALPLAALVFGFLGGRAGLATTTLHPTGRLAELVVLDEAGMLAAPPPDELTAYRQAGADRAALMTAAADLESRAKWLGHLVGALFGMVVVLHLARVRFPAPSEDYETDRAHCVSCARCFKSCPYELVRRGIPVELPPETPQGGRNG